MNVNALSSAGGSTENTCLHMAICKEIVRRNVHSHSMDRPLSAGLGLEQLL